MSPTITTQTTLFGVIGDPVGHSLGPAMHNAALKAMGYPAVYLAFHVTDVAGAITAVRSLKISGLSVTIPHKVAVMGCLDEIDDLARQIGAVNTVVNRDGCLEGVNTDCFGAVSALAEKTDLVDKSVAVLGAGGAARAVGFGLAAKGARLTILNRNVERGQKLAQDLRAGFAPLAEFDQCQADIVVNTTSVGMTPHAEALPIPAQALAAHMVVMDIVYNPLETALIGAARAKGCEVVDGLAMFVYQGVRQLELWTGQKAPMEIMRQAVLDALPDNP